VHSALRILLKFRLHLEGVMSSDHHARFRLAKRIVIAVVGGTITLIGIALLILPGPAFIVIPVGLSILATEFVWARRFLRKAREIATKVASKTKSDP
jgi:tellurite resistance protein TerC